MFDPNATVIDAFTAYSLKEFCDVFPSPEVAQKKALERAINTALETLLSCDCSYHDLQHTILVTDVGQTILRGRQLTRGDLCAHDWLHAVVGMLFHDVGYLRNLLAADDEVSSVINAAGDRVQHLQGATDASMTPHHVTRGRLYVQERFANDPVIDTEYVANCVEMTRFPVPTSEFYQATESLPALVRSADLIGQMADPQYLQKLSRLFAEFTETGEAQRLGFENTAELKAGFPEFFYNHVHPFIGEGVEFLKRTQQGRIWVANLYHHLYVNHHRRELDPKLRAPELVVDNIAEALR